MTERERLWASVIREGECWIWTGARAKTGHGAISVKRGRGWTLVHTHRLAWQHLYGTIPSALLVCHTCDNPPCVRPSHLYLGTKADNANDAVRRGGMNSGTRNAFSRLDPQRVQAIRHEAAEGRSSRALGLAYGVSHTTIQRIVNGAYWAHVPTTTPTAR